MFSFFSKGTRTDVYFFIRSSKLTVQGLYFEEFHWDFEINKIPKFPKQQSLLIQKFSFFTKKIPLGIDIFYDISPFAKNNFGKYEKGETSVICQILLSPGSSSRGV